MATDIRKKLTAAGDKRRQAKTLRAEAAATLAADIPAARKAGVTIAEIGELADLSHQAVHNILNGGTGATPTASTTTTKSARARIQRRHRGRN